ncbi:MAG: two-component system response regulator [Euryarchaeota archaeon RBG_16_68_13]|nr:MAG: two-component system response regulator [Euryarchaeota archaeon RBG_16_68_13]
MSSMMPPILLVEDNADDVLLTSRGFTQAKIANPIQVVGDGQEAISYLKGEGKFADRIQFPIPVLVLLDLKLPRKSGLEVLEWIRTQNGLRRLPVVVLTASKQLTDINRAYDFGANSYLVKPVKFETLIEIVKQLNMYWLIMNEKPEVSP